MTDSDPSGDRPAPPPVGMAAVSTKNAAAYSAYARGLDRKVQHQFSIAELRKAIDMFAHAVEQDPTFVEAYAELSAIHTYLYYNGEERKANSESAKAALASAQALDAESLVVRNAAAFYHYQVEENTERFIEELSAIAEEAPGSPELFVALGTAERGRGRYPEALERLLHAWDLAQPRPGDANQNLLRDRRRARIAAILGETYRAMREYASADHWYRAALEQAPDYPSTWTDLVMNLVAWKGGGGTLEVIEQASRILDGSPVRHHPLLYPARLILDHFAASLASRPRALEIYRQITERIRSRSSRAEQPPNGSFFWYEAMAFDRLGQTHRASALVEASRGELSKMEDPGPLGRVQSAIGSAYLGLRDEALAESEAAVENASASLFLQPRVRELQAIVFVFLGEHPRAIARLETLIETSYRFSINPSYLRLDPVWDPLRAYPRFRELSGE